MTKQDRADLCQRCGMMLSMWERQEGEALCESCRSDEWLDEMPEENHARRCTPKQ